jgi:Fe-S-cluster containining protein
MPLPWRYIENWNCNACGVCCKGFEVVLDFPEWINIVKTYGVDYTVPGLSRLHLKHKGDGTCIFLDNYYGSWLCQLQYMKPMALQALAIQDQRQAKIRETKRSRILFEQHETIRLRRSPMRRSPLGHPKPRVHELHTARICRPCARTTQKTALLHCDAVQPASVETNLGFPSRNRATND